MEKHQSARKIYSAFWVSGEKGFFKILLHLNGTEGHGLILKNRDN